MGKEILFLVKVKPSEIIEAEFVEGETPAIEVRKENPYCRKTATPGKILHIVA
jgi:hypothetical protein